MKTAVDGFEIRITVVENGYIVEIETSDLEEESIVVRHVIMARERGEPEAVLSGPEVAGNMVEEFLTECEALRTAIGASET